MRGDQPQRKIGIKHRMICAVLLLIGAFPTGGYGFGYRSHGLLGTILIIILILWLLGKI